MVCGCMFSGKTEELIRRLNRALIARQKVEIFKPVVDSRYHKEDIVSHNENSIRSTPVQFANDIILFHSVSLRRNESDPLTSIFIKIKLKF